MISDRLLAGEVARFISALETQVDGVFRIHAAPSPGPLRYVEKSHFEPGDVIEYYFTAPDGWISDPSREVGPEYAQVMEISPRGAMVARQKVAGCFVRARFAAAELRGGATVETRVTGVVANPQCLPDSWVTPNHRDRVKFILNPKKARA